MNGWRVVRHRDQGKRRGKKISSGSGDRLVPWVAAGGGGATRVRAERGFEYQILSPEKQEKRNSLELWIFWPEIKGRNRAQRHIILGARKHGRTTRDAVQENYR